MKQEWKYFLEKQLRFSPYFYHRLNKVQNLDTLSPDEIREKKEKKFLKLFRKAYHQSPFYASLYKGHGIRLHDIQSIEDLAKLPVIEKKDIFGLQNKIFTGYPWNKFTARSSGTSGASLTVFRDYQSVVEEGAYQWAHRMRFGHAPGMKTLVLRGNLTFQEKERYDPFTKTLYLSSFRLNGENAKWYYDRIKEFAPNAIFAYPSSVETLANLFMERNLSLNIPLIFTSSETLYSYQREKIEQVFSTRMIDWYGNAERSIALREDENNVYEQIPLYSINEFRKDDVVSTSLINRSFPLIRYKVDDVLLPARDSLPTNTGAKIRQVQGRSDDVLILDDGTRIGLVCNIFDGIPHILLSQVVQESLSQIVFKLVVSPAYSSEEARLLKKQITESIGEDMSYILRYVEEKDIIKSKNGKFKLVINRLNTSQSETSIHSEPSFAT